MTVPGRDAAEAEALLTDRYLESLLAADDRRASDAPSDAALDPGVRDAASRLRHDLLRIHPSFRFEERLAARLADAARSMRLAPAAGEGGTVLAIDRPGPVAGAAGGPFAPLADPLDPLVDPLTDPLADPLGDPLADPTGLPRPLLIGGALTSAALSLAGVAWVAWRRTRPPARSPMARAARAVRAAQAGGAAVARRRPN